MVWLGIDYITLFLGEVGIQMGEITRPWISRHEGH